MVWLPGLKRNILIALVAVAALITVLLVQQERAYQRASYKGKHVRVWAAELGVNFDPRGTNDAMTAFRVIGSNAVPALRSLLNTRPPFYEKLFLKNARRIPASLRYLFEKMKPGRTAALRVGAAQALGVIGPAAESAVPDLMAVLVDGDVRWAAAQSLARIGGTPYRRCW